MKNPFKRKRKGGSSIRYVGTPVYYNEIGSASSKNISQKIDKLLQETTSQPDKEHNPEKFKDESRKMIALTFVFAFVAAVAVVLLFVPIYNAIVFDNARVVVQETNYQPLDIEKILATLGSILGTPLGFVVGYYFKEEHNNKQARQRQNLKDK